MRKFIFIIFIVIFSLFLLKFYKYKNIIYIKENYKKDNLNYNILTIDKINLKEIVKEDTIKSKNISEVVLFKEFGRPNKKYSNTIIGAHSGTGRKAKFKDLNKLSLNDKIEFYYANETYKYMVIEKFFIHEKDFTILNDIRNKTTLTLITCNNSDDKYRLVVVLELIDFI